jgi:hypothetical protein
LILMHSKTVLIMSTLVLVLVNLALADCPLAHTHIGINPTWRPDWSDPGNPDKATDPDPTDDNKLWFFSLPPVHPIAPTPGWPNWEQDDGSVFLQLVPELESGNPILKPGDATKQLWTCRFMWSETNGYGDPAGIQHLDGWHSADGPQGKWNLESIDESTVPAWDIYLKRESTSVAEDDFFMLLPDDTPVLTANGDSYQLEKRWAADENIWEIHEHMGFYFWLTPDIGQEVTATFSAYDAGGMYSASDNYDLTFVTVPEPASLLLLSLGTIPFLRTKSRKCKV